MKYISSKILPIFALAFFVLSGNAFSQSTLLQSGTYTAGHVPLYVSQGNSSPIVIDSGTAAGGNIGVGLSELLLAERGYGPGPYANAGTGPNFSNFCDYDGPTTSLFGYHYLCFGPNSGGQSVIVAGSVGSTALPLNIISPGGVSINGNQISTAGLISGVTAGNGLTGGGVSGNVTLSVLGDSNFAISSAGIGLASILPGNLLANTSSVTSEPLSVSLTSLFDRIFGTVQGSIIYRSNSSWTNLAPGTSGQVLQTQGAGFNPVWNSLSGVGTVTSVTAGSNLTGGTITSSGTIALSPNIILGNGGTTSGSIAVANGNSGGQLVNILNPSTTVGYNFNLPSSSGSVGQALISQGGGANAPTWSTISPPAGSARNLKMIIPSASASATMTWDEVVVESALGVGGNAYKVANTGGLGINLGTTGAGGMDTGSAPISGFISIYAIYNPTTGTVALLACNMTVSSGTLYTGANMPSGFTASALVSSWATDSSGHLITGSQRDRHISRSQVTTLSAGTNTSITPISLSSAVPVNAISYDGLYFNALGYGCLYVDTSANGILCAAANAGMAIIGHQIFTSQTIYYNVVSGSAALIVSGYSF